MKSTYTNGKYISIAANVKASLCTTVKRASRGYKAIALRIATFAAFAGLLVTVPGISKAANISDTFTMGVGTHIGTGIGDSTRLLPMVQTANFNAVRDDALWSVVEQRSGSYAIWNEPSVRLLNALPDARTRGIQPLLILGSGNRLYGGGLPITEAAQNAFVKYAVYVASRLKGQVYRYEIFNEWNAFGGNARGDNDPAAYARLLKKVYPALKAVDPNITVLGGGAVGQYWGIRWTESILQQGAGNYMDGLSLHPYNYWAGADAIPEKAFDMVTQSRALLLRYAPNRNVPIYVTEIGWPVYSGTTGVNQSTQADYLARFYIEAASTSYVKGVWWFNLRDDPNATLGLSTETYAPKAGLCAMGQIGKLFRQSYYSNLGRAANGVNLARIPQTDGSYVYAIWQQTKNVTTTVTLHSQDRPNPTYSASGVCKAAGYTRVGAAGVSVVATGSPIFIRTNSASLAITSMR